MEFFILLLVYILTSLDNVVMSEKIQISLDGIGAIVNCHQEFILRGLPKSDAKVKNHYRIEPYLYLQTFIKECLQREVDELELRTEINECYEQILAKSGFEHWFQEKIGVLTKELQEINSEKDISVERLGLDEDLRKKNARLSQCRIKVEFMSFALKSAHYRIAGSLLAQLVPRVLRLYDLKGRRYARFQGLLMDTVANVDEILRYRQKRGSSDMFNFDQFEKISQNLSKLLEPDNLLLTGELPISTSHYKRFWWKWISGQEGPKVKRVLWMVRHSEKLTNVDKHFGKGQNVNGKCIEAGSAHNECSRLYDPRRIFMWDNSPLSPLGMGHADKFQAVFAEIPISHIFVSPMERTVDTAHRLLGDNHPGILIKLEAGIVEKLSLCANPPSYQSCEELAKAGYQRLDCEYQSLFSRKSDSEKGKEIKDSKEDRWKSSEILDTEKETKFGDEDGILPRVKRALEHILKVADQKSDLPGKESKVNTFARGWMEPEEKEAEHIVLVSHGGIIGASHQLIAGCSSHVTQSSISKFVEFETTLKPYGEKDFFEDSDKVEGKTALDNFRLIFAAEMKHLKV